MRGLYPALVAAAVLAVVGGVGGYLWYRSVEADRVAVESQQRETERLTKDLADKKRELDEKQRQLDDLQETRSHAPDPAEVEKLQRDIEAEKSKAKQPAPPVRPPPKPNCLPGGPVCNAID